MEEFYKAIDKLYQPGSKTGMLYAPYNFNWFLFNKLNKSQPPEFLPDRYQTDSFVFNFPRLHFFYEIFDRKLQQYTEADLINYSLNTEKEYADPEKFKKYQEPDDDDASKFKILFCLMSVLK